MAFDNAYDAIMEAGEDTRWAFGTGFSDPLAGVDTRVPDGVDGADLAAYCLMLGDDALVLSHWLQQWCTRAPELEEEVALANIALDLLGQARLLLARAGTADGTGRDEDRLAFFRDEHEFRNVRLVEVAGGDFAHTMARLLVFSTWRLALLERLAASRDQVLASVAAKGVKEVTYHRDHAASWVVRLGDGTPLSHERMRQGLDDVWPLVGELFVPHPVELRLAAVGVAVDPSTLREEFDRVVEQVLTTATLEVPQEPALPGVTARTGEDAAAGTVSRMGRHGVHTEAMGYLLAELQSLARAHPEAVW